MFFLLLCASCTSDEASDGNVTAVGSSVGPVTASYHGRTLFQGSKSPAPDLAVHVVAARDDGSPGDDVFGTANSDASGRFTVTSTAPSGRRVVLVAAAVEEMAETSGDRRGQGYEVKKRETVLGTLPDPNPSAANTLLVHPKQPGRPEE